MFKVGTVVSIRPAVNIVLFALILPNLSRSLAWRLEISVPQADLLVAKGSSILLVAGLILIGLGQSLEWIVIGKYSTFHFFCLGISRSLFLYLRSRDLYTGLGV
jgi:hypothetical protein